MTPGSIFLYVREDLETELDLVPAAIGYRSVADENADEYRYERGARRFEVATASPAPHDAGLTDAIDCLEAIGLDAIEDRIETLTDRLKAGLPEERVVSPQSDEPGLVTIAVDDSEATVERLADRGIVFRSLPTPDAIRASVHAFNKWEDVDALLEALSR